MLSAVPKSSIKQLFIPGMLFENMGLTYLEPVDGHNMRQMMKLFNEAKRVEGAVVVHVITEKGRGYKPRKYLSGQVPRYRTSLIYRQEKP